MKFNIKKTLIDPITEKKIKVPTVKDIMLLKEAGTYDKFNEIVEKQNKTTFGSIWKVATPVIAGAASIGVAAYEYISMRFKNGKCKDAAELLINEAAALSKIIEKEND